MNTTEFNVEKLRHNDTGETIAQCLNITPTSVSLKSNGKSEFTQGEIARLKERWDLSPERVNEIFFAN